MINFYKITDTADVAKVLYDKICAGLDRGKVLWLVGGGSVMDIAVRVARDLSGHKNISSLTVTLTDERYGSVGHADSNWQQLQEKGFLLQHAQLKPVITGGNLDATVKDYCALLEQAILDSNYSVALGGMGADGHIFGIKPDSPATDSHQLVEGYKWQDYTRITPTIEFIKQLDEIIIYAAGKEKHAQLDRIEQAASVQDQPAQLLKQAGHVSIYNDYKGDKL